MDLVADAEAIAQRAMQAAGVEIVELTTMAEFAAFSDLADEIWERSEKWVAPERLALRAEAGAYIVGMYDAETRQMIGLSLGYPDSDEPDALYKDISGMVVEARRKGRFRSLLMFERAWGFRNGFETMVGSFDPLQRRNAWLNVERRAQTLTHYVVNKYGTPTSGSVDGFDDTDRFSVRWNIRSPEVLAALEGRREHPDEDRLRADGATDLVDDGGRVMGLAVGDGPWLCATPEDITTLRTEDAVAATRWRISVRDVMVAAYADDIRVTGVTPSGRYVLGRT